MNANTATIFALLLCALSGNPLTAQSWDALRGLNPGDKIRVLNDTGQEQHGTFKAVSDEAISIETHQGELAIERPHIRRVQIRSNERRVRNTIIGAAIGLGISVAVDQTLGAYLRNESGDSGRAITYTVPIALLGGLSAAIPAYKTLYRTR